MSMSNTEKTVKDIRRNTRRKFSTEEKIHIVLDVRGRITSIAKDEKSMRKGRIPAKLTSWVIGFVPGSRITHSGPSNG